MRFDELWKSIDEKIGVDLLDQYLADGGDINARDPDFSWTLLHLACEHMNHDLIRALSAAGADLNARTNHQGWSPLHLAVDADTDSWVQANDPFDELTFSTTCLLLSLGADSSVRDRDGLTPRDIAAEYGIDVAEKYDNLTKNWIDGASRE
jgi:ankyrin repeat protein